MRTLPSALVWNVEGAVVQALDRTKDAAVRLEWMRCLGVDAVAFSPQWAAGLSQEDNFYGHCFAQSSYLSMQQ